MAVLRAVRSLGLQEGKYPVWYPCSPQTQNGTVLTCGGHAPDATLKGFHPYETCATMHDGWFCKGDGVGGRNTYWSAAEIWVSKAIIADSGSATLLSSPTSGRNLTFA